jgi:hypothetical protein
LVSPATPVRGGIVRQWLVGIIVVGAVVAGLVTELTAFRITRPPDATATALAGLWLASPYLAAAGLAVWARRHAAALIALLIALAVVGPIGVFLFDASATQQDIAAKQAQTAVLPGEDPDRGPAGMRKASADMGVFVGDGVGILLGVFLPPIQLAVVIASAGIGYGVSVWLRRRRNARREWEIEHTDTRQPAG